MPPKAAAPAKSAKGDAKDAMVLSFTLAEAGVELDEGTKDAPKREIVLTLLREGPGNPKDRRYYERPCVEGLESLLYSRRKLFLNHLGEGAAPASDDIKNWAATLMTTWTIEGADGMMERKGRLKIHNNWLWELCKDEVARKEIAVSIEGRGAGRVEKRNGQDYTCIEKIYWLNAFKFVPYPGNATMGADVVEGAAQAAGQTTEEDLAMDPKLITLSLLEGQRPDLVEAIAAKVKAELAEAAKTSGDAVAALREEFSKKLDDRTKGLTSTISKLEERNAELEKKLDASEVREKMASKETIIAAALKEAALPAEAVTPRFMATLRSVVAREEADDKGVKRLVSVEEQVKAEIAERKALMTPVLGSVKGAGAIKKGSDAVVVEGEISEDEKQFLFDKEFLGLHEGDDLASYRKKKAAAKKKADGENDDDEDDKADAKK